MHNASHNHSPYRQLAYMLVLSFVAMYGLMYAMVDTSAHAYNNVNQFYMAAMMVGAMLALELVFMHAMYPKHGLNHALLAIGVALTIVGWLLVRYQAGVGDQQFLRSMIPHHAGAILMCENAGVSGKEVKALCARIVESQRKEIAEMQSLLEAKSP